MKRSATVAVAVCLALGPRLSPAAPMAPTATMTIEGTIKKIAWHPAKVIRGRPGMSGSAAVDRTIPAHYDLTLTDTKVTSKEDGPAPFESGATIEISLEHPKNDSFLKQKMAVRIIDFRMTGDEGGVRTSFDKIEILSGKPAGAPAGTADKDQGKDQPRPVLKNDMLTPLYYRSAEGSPFRAEVGKFLAAARKEVFRHPLQPDTGPAPMFRMPPIGDFGAGKGPGGDKEHHPACDFHVGRGETNVVLYAAHDGRVTTFRNAPKYRQYLAITKDVLDDDGRKLGKIVTLYAHVDLDLDKAEGLSMDGKTVRKGDVVSRHLYSGTMGGPHLHFEVRYYRPGDKGSEEFYGFRFPGMASSLTEKPAGPWSYGFWDPKVGYGFAHPQNHGVSLTPQPAPGPGKP